MNVSSVSPKRGALAPSAGALHLVVGIPSTGRKDILARTLRQLARQDRQPDEVVVCVCSQDDIDRNCLADLACPSRVLISSRGSCRQRNGILDAVPQADVVVFLDDDFLMTAPYLEEIEQLFSEHPDVVIATGTVIADGITGPGISLTEGIDRILAAELAADYDPDPLHAVNNGYGCNMAVRMSAVRGGNLRFDEDMPLYGWLEDVDFSRMAARHGRVVKSTRLTGVHLGTKLSRTSGARFGYSQIANPIYLARKGTMTVRHAGLQMARNVAANAAKVWRPEPWVDRKGRLRGNLRAFADLLFRRLAPGNIETMD
ncbi:MULTISPECIES: glycosyltransferase family 2 protein [Alphaproteobacteria]|uniref:Glycosyl transferase n=2 Tax=Alphaproteobacteria TaxID=28211 RepID=A0A512HN47_9HYPH|nr:MULTISPECIES: glycosyltransferase family 2 protein [Alphaproteobacteria]GEO86878.1 glycosyl transferase [Ciceribacter naphthalenivorans]GLR24022.1 glycosyl transferase [Ciceribacter naphthalenivorans]GLT06878.1 glycosyl transferase [Sphingomonas psychrolutea]